MGRTTIALSIAAVAICAAIAALAQSKELPSFEVASVRMSPGGTQFSQFSQRLTDTRVDITTPLGWVLFTAFRAQYYEFQISAPGWLNDVWVEIHATMPAGATVAQVPEMLQRLLAERFGLVVHREVRQMDGYELVVGPDGAKMREVEPVNELRKEFPPEPPLNGRPRNDTTTETPDGTVRTMSTVGGFRRITSRTMFERTVVLEGGSIFNATRMTMAELAPFLWETMDAPVVDKTGLTGVYQFTLTLPRGAMVTRISQVVAAEVRARAATVPVPVGSSSPEPDRSTGVSTLKALEGLGLKLERRRVPLEVVVVDKISRTPTDN